MDEQESKHCETLTRTYSSKKRQTRKSQRGRIKMSRFNALAVVAVACLPSTDAFIAAPDISSSCATSPMRKRNIPQHLVTADEGDATTIRQHVLHSSSTLLKAVTDPDVLLRDYLESTKESSDKSSGGNKKQRGPKRSTTRIQKNMNDLYKLESVYGYNDSFSDDDATLIQQAQANKSPVASLDNETLTSSKSSRKQKSASQLKIKTSTSTKRSKSKSVVSKSSTMPGFFDKSTGRIQSFQHGLKIAKSSNKQQADKIEQAVMSEQEQKNRRKSNSQAMYRSSATVPDSLIDFANEIHKESRITPKEELELGTKTQEAIEIQKIYEDLEEKFGRKPTNNEWCAAAGKINFEALENALNDGIEAKNKLVLSNLRMVQGVVNLYIRNGLGSQYNAGDLMQEGVTALIRAAEKFEPQRGFRFSTYAMYWIRAAVKRSQILQSRVINVPQRLHETHKKISKVEVELKKELGRKPNKVELAEAVGISETQLDRCLKAMAQQCFSLDAELENTLNPNKADMNRDTMHNALSAQYDNVELNQLKSIFMKEDLVDTLRRYLDPPEVDLLLLRYGLMDEKTVQYGFSGPLTIAEVSRLVGLKPDKVRRMINKSLRQLRHLIAHEWEDFEKELS